MNSTNRLIVGAAIASLIATAGLTAVTQAAPNGESQREKPEYIQEARDAVDNNDYQAWANALAEHPEGTEFVNEATFATIVEAHALKEAGDREGARALLEEAGIRRPGKSQRGGETRQAAREALQNGDYAAWSEALADRPNADEFVNEETFATLQEAHALKEAGDIDGAKALLEEAGIKRPGRGQR